MTPSLYFIRSGSLDGPIKIGCADSPLTRLVQLQCGNPEQLVLTAAAPGSERLERCLHRYVKEHRIRGEWFYPVGVLVALEALLRFPVSLTSGEMSTGHDNALIIARELNDARLNRKRLALLLAYAKKCGWHLTPVKRASRRHPARKSLA